MTNGKTKPFKYPFRTMSVGQKVRIPVILAEDGFEAANWAAVKKACWRAERGTGKIFRWVERDGTDYYNQAFVIERVK